MSKTYQFTVLTMITSVTRFMMLILVLGLREKSFLEKAV